MRARIIILALAASQVGATDCGQAIKDPGFDLWCGDTLCSWTTERGAIAKVPTWNKGDPGVELVGDDVAIDQVSPVAASDGSCIELDLIANVDEHAQVEINFDIYDDGSIDSTQIIPTSSWAPLSFVIDIDSQAWSGLKFEITKTGTGTAVLAQISATVLDASQCTGFTPITPMTIPTGAPCWDSGDCATGDTCTNANALAPGTCVGCQLGSDGSDPCGAGSACGYAPATSPTAAVPVACIPTGSIVLGEPCLADADCATDRCVMGGCSTCTPGGSDCADGQCTPGWPPAFAGEAVPYICDGGSNALASGAPCADDRDCASHTCNGTAQMECADGRSCATDDDCPFDDTDGDNAFNHSACISVGIIGGSCQ